MRPSILFIQGLMIASVPAMLGAILDVSDLKAQADTETTFGHGPNISAAALAWMDFLTSPWISYIGVAIMVAAVGLYLFGWSHPALANDTPPQPQSRPIAAPALSPPAIAATDRVNAALDRLRLMPADTFSPESTIELAAIRDQHLPSLRSAHAKARAAFPVEGPEAGTLDADLAGSLDRIADKLDELIADCGNEARQDFATERRFIELRHPTTSDPLALPSVHIVRAGE